jgi:hypothetical protein
VFELLNRDWPIINITAFNMLEKIILNSPQYEIDSKLELINIIDNSENNDYRSYSLECLERHYGAEFINKYEILFQMDTYWIVRQKSLEYLVKYNYVGFKEILTNQLPNDSYWVLRNKIAQTILNNYGEPSDLKIVSDYQPSEPNETARSLMAYFINDFIPPKPDTLNWNELATRLISYSEEMYGYEWISSESVRDYYIDMLLNVISIMEGSEGTGVLEAACSILDERILAQAEQDLQEELITNEGYKFLHYYTIYIKEEIEEVLGPCP